VVGLTRLVSCLQVPPAAGAVAVGAAKWVVNLNVPLAGQAGRGGSVEFGIARRIARGLSERGGGLPEVQAMALRHGEGGPTGALTDRCWQPDVAPSHPSHHLPPGGGGR
jgi:hypothetical protein